MGRFSPTLLLGLVATIPNLSKSFQISLHPAKAPARGILNLYGQPLSPVNSLQGLVSSSHKHDKLLPIYASASSEEEQEEEEKEEKTGKMKEFQSESWNMKSQFTKYRWMKFSWLLLAYFGSTVYFKYDVYGMANSVGFAMGNFLASGVNHIFISANANRRLGSDSYKRLSLIMMVFSLLNMTYFKEPLVAITGMLGYYISLDGLRCGLRGYVTEELEAKGFKDVIAEAKRIFKDTLKGLTVAKNNTSRAYLGAFYLFSVVNILHNIPLLLLSIKKGEPGLKIYSKFASIARLWLAGGVSYVLKDASDRDRLGGTTFVQLNFLTAAWAGAVAVAAILPKWYGPSFLFKPSQAYKVAAVMAPLSALYGCTAVSSLLKKKKDKQKAASG